MIISQLLFQAFEVTVSITTHLLTLPLVSLLTFKFLVLIKCDQFAYVLGNRRSFSQIFLFLSADLTTFRLFLCHDKFGLNLEHGVLI